MVRSHQRRIIATNKTSSATRIHTILQLAAHAWTLRYLDTVADAKSLITDQMSIRLESGFSSV
jgi:hypothetical protein